MYSSSGGRRVRAMVVFGTRPEAIKMAPVIHALKADPEGFEVLTCVTGQHREMLDQVLKLFQITPDIDLDLMRPNQDLVGLIAAILSGVRDALITHRPDVVLVHGDTATTMATSMAAFMTGHRVLHVEAGLRTFDVSSPFPEEFNRQVVGRIASIHCVPTETGRRNLVNEGVADDRIFVTGNTVIDALMWVLDRIDRHPTRRAAVEGCLQSALSFDWRRDRFVLITGHRRENFGRGFDEICDALSILATDFPDVHFVYPVHLNPNVATPVRNALSEDTNLHLVNPLGYEEFALLLRQSKIVLTDSGGIQEEAPSLGKPVLVMREVTERPEAVSAGTVKLVGANRDRIVAGVTRLLTDDVAYNQMAQAVNPYGDGKSSERIVEAIKLRI
jgi:UDP-N-acetylglucosamine 2-epimerase (non-hydrolysing)